MQNWGTDNSDTPLVSVRCVTYNHEPYIAQALDGFLMQKTNFPFEVIVHDDASTDRTAEIIREYEARFPKIIKPIYETENQYSKHDGSLRRIMDAACKGKYIAFCEGDDYWIDENKLQMQVDFLEKHDDYSTYYSNVEGIDKDGNPLYYVYMIYPFYPSHTIPQSCSLWFGVIGQTATCVTRASVLSKYPNGLLANGDMIISFLAMAKGNVYYSGIPFARHRKVFHGDSWTAKTWGKDMSLWFYKAYMELFEYSRDVLGKSYSNEKSYLSNFIWMKLKECIKKPSINNFLELFEMLRLCTFKRKLLYLLIKRKKEQANNIRLRTVIDIHGGGYNLEPYTLRASCIFRFPFETPVRKIA